MRNFFFCIVTEENLPVIIEDTDSEAANASSDCEAFSEPSSISSLDSSRLCVSPHQVQGIPRVEESQRMLDLPMRRTHRRSLSAIEPIQKPVRPNSAPKATSRRRRSSSMSDQMEDKENSVLSPVCQGEWSNTPTLQNEIAILTNKMCSGNECVPVMITNFVILLVHSAYSLLNWHMIS